ncbi:unnamed protein product, partial [Urochloa humidicola]
HHCCLISHPLSTPPGYATSRSGEKGARGAAATSGAAASEAAVDGVVSSTCGSRAQRSVPVMMDPPGGGASTTPGQAAAAAATTTVQVNLKDLRPPSEFIAPSDISTSWIHFDMIVLVVFERSRVHPVEALTRNVASCLKSTDLWALFRPSHVVSMTFLVFSHKNSVNSKWVDCVPESLSRISL